MEVSRETSPEPPADDAPLADLLRFALAEADMNSWLGHAPMLARHLAEVLECNKRVNLTAIRNPVDAVRLHVIDSLEALRPGRSTLVSPVLDIGSGAGFPGVPIAIVGSLDVTLLESTQKKARFLEEFVRMSGLGHCLNVQATRAEELALTEFESFESAISRAVAALPSLVELAAPAIRHGGTFVAMKGALDDEERGRGRDAAALVGLEEVSVERYALAGGGEARVLVTYRKTGESSIELPRRPGMAQTRPLR